MSLTFSFLSSHFECKILDGLFFNVMFPQLHEQYYFHMVDQQSIKLVVHMQKEPSAQQLTACGLIIIIVHRRRSGSTFGLTQQKRMQSNILCCNFQSKRSNFMSIKLTLTQRLLRLFSFILHKLWP